MLDGCKQFDSYYNKEKFKIKVAKWGRPKTIEIFFLINNFCIVMFIFCARFLFLWETSKKVHNEQNYLFDNTAYFAEIDFSSNNEKVFLQTLVIITLFARTK